MKKRTIKIIIICILSFCNIFAFVYSRSNSDTKKEQEIRVEDNAKQELTFEEIDYNYIPSVGSQLTVKISNLTASPFTIDSMKLVSKDKDNNVVLEIEAVIYVELASQEEIVYVFEYDDGIMQENGTIDYIVNY